MPLERGDQLNPPAIAGSTPRRRWQLRIDLHVGSGAAFPPERPVGSRPMDDLTGLTSIEVCSGAGGQALGLEQAGFEHLACVEIDDQACATLRHNRPEWNVIEDDLRAVVHQRVLEEHFGCDLLAGGVPCPPFSLAGKQLGAMTSGSVPRNPRSDGAAPTTRGHDRERSRAARSEVRRLPPRDSRTPSNSDTRGPNGSFSRPLDYGVPQLRPQSDPGSAPRRRRRHVGMA